MNFPRARGAGNSITLPRLELDRHDEQRGIGSLAQSPAAARPCFSTGRGARDELRTDTVGFYAGYPPPNILKRGGDIFLARGKFSQIWKSSSRFSSVWAKQGNISACEMPAPAVIHCTSPSPNSPRRPAVRVVDEASDGHRYRLEAAVRVLREACTPPSPWYMLHPAGLPVRADAVAAGDASGPIFALPFG